MKYLLFCLLGIVSAIISLQANMPLPKPEELSTIEKLNFFLWKSELSQDDKILLQKSAETGSVFLAQKALEVAYIHKKLGDIKPKIETRFTHEHKILELFSLLSGHLIKTNECLMREDELDTQAVKKRLDIVEQIRSKIENLSSKEAVKKLLQQLREAGKSGEYEKTLIEALQAFPEFSVNESLQALEENILNPNLAKLLLQSLPNSSPNTPNYTNRVAEIQRQLLLQKTK